MKKEYFYAIGAFVILFFISIFLICGMKVNAEENTTTEDNTSEVSNTEEENTDIVNNDSENVNNDSENVNTDDNVSTDDDNVSTDDDNTTTTEEDEDATFTEMLDSFLDKWLMPIISFILGIAGTSFATVVMKRIYEKILDKITKTADKTEEEKQQAITTLNETKTSIEEWITKFQDAVNALNESNTNSVLNTKSAQAMLESLVKKENYEALTREAISLIVAGIPELQRNGTASKIIELLQDTLTTDDETDSTDDNVTTEEDTTTTKEV